MSGTSLDGVDLAHVSLVRDTGWSFQIHHAEGIPYSSEWREKLQTAIHLDKKGLVQLNEEYTQFLGNLIRDFITDNIDQPLLAVCSHGHTILHEPDKGKTLQIGNLPKIAAISGQRVVCDFRTQDVAMGGQGAPLVPIGDRLLFSEYDYCLNLGGFSNVSHEKNGGRIAYDICPVNVVFNSHARKLGKEYDENGAFAKAGKIQSPQLQQLNALAYYNQPAPKSLGVEWVEKNVMPILNQITNPKDALATFTEHAAQQISGQFEAGKSVLVTGGGAFNAHLINRIKYHCDCKFIIPDNQVVEYKEALIFAMLGVLRLRNEVNCLASVTGASQDHSCGQVFVP
jgi:anhydro-N-acetylmuramic acid kinase